MAKFITAQEAAALIPDNATVGVGGMGLAGWPEEIACAIRDRFKETGHPCNLDVHQGSAMGQHEIHLGWKITTPLVTGIHVVRVRKTSRCPRQRSL